MTIVINVPRSGTKLAKKEQAYVPSLWRMAGQSKRGCRKAGTSACENKGNPQGAWQTDFRPLFI